MKVKVVIPARYGSTRLPGKPLLNLCGRPMFWHVVQRALEAGVDSNDIVIATDHESIYNEAIRLNIKAVITSRDHISGTDRINEVARAMNWDDEFLIVNVQGDEPLIPFSVISRLIEFSLENKQFNLSTAVTKVNSENDLLNENIVKVALGEKCQAVYFSRAPIPFKRADVEKMYCSYRHIGIYAYTVKNLKKFCKLPESALEKQEKLEQLRALSNGLAIGAVIVKDSPQHGVDTKEDYLRIKKVMESNNEHN